MHVDNSADRRTDVADPAVTNERGEAKLNVWLPGCPEVKFEVYAQPPRGYKLTTRARLSGEGPFSFGFKKRL